MSPPPPLPPLIKRSIKFSYGHSGLFSKKAFAFNDFESLLQNFGLIWTSSKFENFGLCDDER
jgi:hypothetical protein